MQKSKKLAVIVGVGFGLGASLCRKLLSEGYLVVGISRSQVTQELLLKEQHQSEALRFYQCDVTDAQQVKKVFAQIQRQFDSVSVLIFNAGVFEQAPFMESDEEQFERIWRTNCYAGMLCVRQVIENMLIEKQGCLVFSGATASIKGSNGFSAFASSKFALRGLAQSLAREYGPAGIHVAHVILDGIIWGERAKNDFGKQMHQSLCPDAIADSYYNLIKQSPSAWTQELDLRPFTESF